MKRLFLTLACLAISTAAFASPFLTCDPYLPAPDTALPEEFVIVLNGFEYVSPAVINDDGSRVLLFDLDGLWSAGPNTLIVWARNYWGESSQVPFDFFAAPPTAPTSTRFVGSLP